MNEEISLSSRVEEFVSHADEMTSDDAEAALLPVLRDLLLGDGVQLVERIRPTVAGIDYVARLRDGGGTIGLEYKHHTSRPVDTDQVRLLANAIAKRPLRRALLISRRGFTTAALSLAHDQYAPGLELLDFHTLRGWAARIERANSGQHSRVLAAIREFSRDLARHVAQNPRELKNLEWRDLERMMAVVLERLGFDARLTPGSKDGGKDIVLALTDGNDSRTYVIELKHWRSGHSVGGGPLKSFAEVVAREQHAAGLFIATSGLAGDAFAALTVAQRKLVKVGSEPKVVSLCRTFVKAETGMWFPAQELLEDLLFEGTV
jgi:restriction system protein